MTHPAEFEELEERVPIGVVRAEAGDVAFYMPSQMTAMRFNTLFTKEPETISWIGGFVPGKVLVDIGANVGMYTIWAAKHRQMDVFAFEPEAQNYAVLNRNIRLNSLDDQVLAFPAAISDKPGFSVLNLGDLRTGGSQNSFDEPVDGNLEPREPLFRQGSFATTLDRLVADKIVPMPDYVKIDVDGFEHKVVEGAEQVFANAQVRSVMIELNTSIEAHCRIIDIMQGFGFNEPLIQSVGLKERGGGNCLFRRGH